ncbi:SDR family oxidoreductase [Croceicoccus hydrothermalis]|uniref:SDR family oxidoreductase n=1 Tax=Croceicoccus hydrothermalis TaxID=2867964 RepID=UPI001EFA5C71|nr:SDR family oxidoreductase [Croceicoccus hydrothermalis]
MSLSEQKQNDRRTVLITGGAKRLGATIARHFSEAGFHVLIHCHRSTEAAHALARSLPSAEVVSADLSKLDTIDRFVADLAIRVPNWTVLVNSAAIFEPDLADDLDPDIFRRSNAINAASPSLLSQAFLRHTRKGSQRRVINLIDQKIANTNPDFFSYTMSKHALFAATRMMAMHFARSSDRIYGLCPGAMLPSHDQHDAEHEQSGRMNLLRRLTSPDELAQAAVFLAKGHVASGATLFLDSGQHLLAQERDVLYLAREGGGGR